MLAPVIEEHREEILALCKRFSVAKLDVFGSAADGTFDPNRSDVDFLVEFQALKPGPLADAYFGLLAEFELIFQRKVDLVTPNAIRNPYFLRGVNETRRPLYAA